MVDPPHLARLVAAATKLRRVFPPGTTYDGDWSHPVYGPSVRDEWIAWHERSGEKDGFDSQAVVMLMDNFKPPAFNFAGIEVGKYWMATLSLTVDVKKGPLEGKKGWGWLFLRARVERCYDGRYTMDITLLDEEGDVVAVGRRAELVLEEERRRPEEKPGKARI